MARRPADDDDDRLSQLPDELLIAILSSYLTIKEAGRTSTLSNRWKTLWTYYYGSFDFDFDYDSNFCVQNYSHKSFQECTCKYADYVNKVLNSHQGFGVPIKKLRVTGRLDSNKFKSSIDSWIEFAMQKRVQHFELDLRLLDMDKHYKFLHERIGFPNDLKVLCLSSVDLTDETLAYLLSSKNCPSLEVISIVFAISLAHVKVVGNLKLKSLELSQCRNIEDVEISSAINMVSFGFRGRCDTKITFGDVPRLNEALFGGQYIKNVVMIPRDEKLMSSFVSRLETLILDLFCLLSDNVRVCHEFPKLDNLKHLVVRAYTPRDIDLNVCLISMIHQCAHLQTFSLKVICTNATWRNKSLRFGGENVKFKEQQHKCLRVLECVGWSGDEDDLEFVSDVVKNAVILDKVIIDPRTIFYSKTLEFKVCSLDEEFVANDQKRKENARKAAGELQTILPKGVSLVIR